MSAASPELPESITMNDALYVLRPELRGGTSAIYLPVPKTVIKVAYDSLEDEAKIQTEMKAKLGTVGIYVPRVIKYGRLPNGPGLFYTEMEYLNPDEWQPFSSLDTPEKGTILKTLLGKLKKVGVVNTVDLVGFTGDHIFLRKETGQRAGQGEIALIDFQNYQSVDNPRDAERMYDELKKQLSPYLPGQSRSRRVSGARCGASRVLVRNAA